MSSRETKRSWMGLAAAGVVLAAVLAAAGWYLWPGGSAEGEAEVWEAYTEEQLEEHRYAAQHYILSDEVPKARVILEKLLEHYPNDAEGRVLMSKVLIAEGKAREAYEQLRGGLDLGGGGRDDLQFLAGVLAYKVGEMDRARYHYTQAAALAPGVAKYRLYLGQLLMKMDDLDRAQEQLLKAHALNSSLTQVYGVLAEISARRGKLDMALEQVNKALGQVDEGDEEQRVRYTLLKALYLRRHNEPEAALRVLWSLPAERQREPRVVEHLAASYLMMSEPAKAAVTWGNLFHEEPTNAAAAAEAGLCFLRAGDTGSARRYLGLAKRIDADGTKVRALEEAMGGS